MKFSVPIFARKENPAGVYKITFDGKHFYIGSSKHLRTRFQNWITAINRGVNKNDRIRKLAKTCSEASFEIMEIVISGDHKERERVFIAQHWGDLMLVNYCQDPNTCLGMKFDGERKKRMSNYGLATRHSGKPIAVFDLDGNLVKEFEFLADAIRFTSADDNAIKKVLTGRTEQAKGYKFKLISPDGYIEPPPFIKKKRVFKGRNITDQTRIKQSIAQRKRYDNGGKISSKSRPVHVFNKVGELVATKPSVRSIYKMIGIKPDKRIEKILRGKKGQSCRGYTFKYA